MSAGEVCALSVFEDLDSAVTSLERVVADLEPGTFDVTGAKKLVDLFTRAERLSVAGRGLAARRVQDAVSWKRDGHRSAAHWLASTTGVSVGAASRSLQTARDLEALPETAEAFRAGELSEAQAAEIAGAATQDPSAEARLLEAAREFFLPGPAGLVSRSVGARGRRRRDCAPLARRPGRVCVDRQ